MNKRLKNEVNKYVKDLIDLPENIQQLLDSVSRSYDAFEKLEKTSKESTKHSVTENRKMQAAVHLEATQKIAHIGTWELDLSILDDLNVNPLYWSDETYRIFGFEPGSVTVTNELFFEHVHPDDIVLIQKAVKKAIEFGSEYDIEHRIILKDGTEKMVRERSSIIIDSRSGKPIKMIGTVENITERKEAEIALRNNEVKFRALIQNAADGITVADENGIMFFASESVYQLTGYTPDEISGKQPFVFIHPDDVEYCKQKHSELLQKPGASMVIQYRRRKKDGSYIWVENTVTNLLHEPSVKGTVANFRDITARVEAENALKQNEYRFRALIENSTDVITVMDTESRVLFASDSIYRVTGYKPEELIGKLSVNFVHPDDLDAIRENMQTVIKNPGRLVTTKYRRLNKNGEYFWCEGTANNLIKNPLVNGIIINFRDITEQTIHENALKASNEELKKSNNELDRFVYSASHDLRAPLSSMLGIVYLMEAEVTQEEIKEDIKLLKTSISKLDGFINDILNHSRNARTNLNITEIHFSQLIHDVNNKLKYMTAGEDDIKILAHINDKIPFYSDPGRLNIILSNIISNAIRYSNPDISDPYVKIDVESRSEDAIIRIQDNGIGISKEYHEKIFEMFYRVSNKSTGSGLGLYIVHETVEKLKGNIQINSELGKGTIFTIKIPNLK